MLINREKRRDKRFYRVLSFLLMVAFGTNVVFPPSLNAQMLPGMMPLSAPANLLASGPAFVPALIKGLRIHPDNPLQFDFIIDTGDSGLKDKALAEESTRMVKYFLAALTVPEDELWVNLSPVEADRVIPDSFGATDMGMDLLAQDYILKQLTASLVYPEKELGKKFWDRIYAQAQEKFGTTDIAFDNFNKVWIVPEQAAVYESGEHVFVMNSHLKVMMEEDYLQVDTRHQTQDTRKNSCSGVRCPVSGVSKAEELTQQIMREIVIPALEKEVNEGSHFAKLRQINQAAILAKWYKQALRESLLGKVYVDQNKTKGIDTARPEQKETIYEQYLEAFRKGIYDYIKEDVDPQTKEITARRYFSGGAGLAQKVQIFRATRGETPDRAMLGSTVIPVRGEGDLTGAQRRALRRAVSAQGNVVRTVFALAENPLTAQSAETDSAMIAQASPGSVTVTLNAYETSSPIDLGHVSGSITLHHNYATVLRRPWIESVIATEKNGVLVFLNDGSNQALTNGGEITTLPFSVRLTGRKLQISNGGGQILRISYKAKDLTGGPSISGQQRAGDSAMLVDDLQASIPLDFLTEDDWVELLLGLEKTRKFVPVSLGEGALNVVYIDAEDLMLDDEVRALFDRIPAAMQDRVGKIHLIQLDGIDAVFDELNGALFIDQEFAQKESDELSVGTIGILTERLVSATRSDLFSAVKQVFGVDGDAAFAALEHDSAMLTAHEQRLAPYFPAGKYDPASFVDVMAASRLADDLKQVLQQPDGPIASYSVVAGLLDFAESSFVAKGESFTVAHKQARTPIKAYLKVLEQLTELINSDVIRFETVRQYDVYQLIRRIDSLRARVENKGWGGIRAPLESFLAALLNQQLRAVGIDARRAQDPFQGDPTLQAKRQALLEPIVEVLRLHPYEAKVLNSVADIDQIVAFTKEVLEQASRIPGLRAQWKRQAALLEQKDLQEKFAAQLASLAQKEKELADMLSGILARVQGDSDLTESDQSEIGDALYHAETVTAPEMARLYREMIRLAEASEQGQGAVLQNVDSAMLTLDERLTQLDTALEKKQVEPITILYNRLASGFPGYTEPDQIAQALTQIYTKLNTIVDAISNVAVTLSEKKTITQAQKDQLDQLKNAARKFLDAAWRDHGKVLEKARASIAKSVQAKAQHKACYGVMERGIGGLIQISHELPLKKVVADNAMLAQQPLTVKPDGDVTQGNKRVVSFTNDSELRVIWYEIGAAKEEFTLFLFFDAKSGKVFRMTKAGDWRTQDWQEAINETVAQGFVLSQGDKAKLSDEQQRLGELFRNGTYDYAFFMKHGGAEAGDKLTALAFRGESIENPDIVTGLLDLFLNELFVFMNDYGDQPEGVSTQEYLALMRSFTQLWARGAISDEMVAQFQRVDELREELAVQIETVDKKDPIRDVLVGFQKQLERYAQRVHVEEERLRLRAEQEAVSLMPLSDEMAVVLKWFEDVEKEGTAFIEAFKASGNSVFEDASWVTRWDALAQTAQRAAEILDWVDDLDGLNRREQNLISQWLVTRGLHELVADCQKRIDSFLKRFPRKDGRPRFLQADAGSVSDALEQMEAKFEELKRRADEVQDSAMLGDTLVPTRLIDRVDLQVLAQSIEILGLPESVIQKLALLNIRTIRDLVEKTRRDLYLSSSGKGQIRAGDLTQIDAALKIKNLTLGLTFLNGGTGQVVGHSIELLPVSQGLKNVLSSRFSTIEQITSSNETTILKTRGIGTAKLAELRKGLSLLGLKLQEVGFEVHQDQDQILADIRAFMMLAAAVMEAPGMEGATKAVVGLRLPKWGIFSDSTPQDMAMLSMERSDVAAEVASILHVLQENVDLGRSYEQGSGADAVRFYALQGGGLVGIDNFFKPVILRDIGTVNTIFEKSGVVYVLTDNALWEQVESGKADIKKVKKVAHIRPMADGTITVEQPASEIDQAMLASTAKVAVAGLIGALAASQATAAQFLGTAASDAAPWEALLTGKNFWYFAVPAGAIFLLLASGVLRRSPDFLSREIAGLVKDITSIRNLNVFTATDKQAFRLNQALQHLNTRPFSVRERAAILRYWTASHDLRTALEFLMKRDNFWGYKNQVLAISIMTNARVLMRKLNMLVQEEQASRAGEPGPDAAMLVDELKKSERNLGQLRREDWMAVIRIGEAGFVGRIAGPVYLGEGPFSPAIWISEEDGRRGLDRRVLQKVLSMMPEGSDLGDAIERVRLAPLSHEIDAVYVSKEKTLLLAERYLGVSDEDPHQLRLGILPEEFFRTGFKDYLPAVAQAFGFKMTEQDLWGDQAMLVEDVPVIESMTGLKVDVARSLTGPDGIKYFALDGNKFAVKGGDGSIEIVPFKAMRIFVANNRVYIVTPSLILCQKKAGERSFVPFNLFSRVRGQKGAPFLVTPKGEVYVGLKGGIVYQAGSNQNFKLFRLDGAGDATVTALGINGDGDVFAGTNQGSYFRRWAEWKISQGFSSFNKIEGNVGVITWIGEIFPNVVHMGTEKGFVVLSYWGNHPKRGEEDFLPFQLTGAVTNISAAKEKGGVRVTSAGGDVVVYKADGKIVKEKEAPVADQAMLTKKEMEAAVSDQNFQKEFLSLLGKRTAFAMLKLDHLGPNGKAIIAIMVKALEKDFQIFFGPQLYLSGSQLDGFNGARKEKDFLKFEVVRYKSGHGVLPLFLLARKGVENPFDKLADARKAIESRLRISDPARNPLYVSAEPASAALEARFMFEMFAVEELSADNIAALIRDGEKAKEAAQAKEEEAAGQEEDVLADEVEAELTLAEEPGKKQTDQAMLAKADADLEQELGRLSRKSGATYYDYWELLKERGFGAHFGSRPINGKTGILDYFKKQDPNSIVYLPTGESLPIREAMKLVQEQSRLRIRLLSEWKPASVLVLELDPLAQAQDVLERKSLSGLVEQAMDKLRGTHYENSRMMDLVVGFLTGDFFMEFQDFFGDPVQDTLREGIRPETIVFSDSETDYLMLDAANRFPELIAALAQMDEGLAREFLNDIIHGVREEAGVSGGDAEEDSAMLTDTMRQLETVPGYGGLELMKNPVTSLQVWKGQAIPDNPDRDRALALALEIAGVRDLGVQVKTSIAINSMIYEVRLGVAESHARRILLKKAGLIVQWYVPLIVEFEGAPGGVVVELSAQVDNPKWIAKQAGLQVYTWRGKTVLGISEQEAEALLREVQQKLGVAADRAMMTQQRAAAVETGDVGGIDLNPALYDLQIKRDGNGVPLPLPQQPIETMHIDGFTPILIEMTPVQNLPMLLGLADEPVENHDLTLRRGEKLFALTCHIPIKQGEWLFASTDPFDRIQIENSPLLKGAFRCRETEGQFV